MNIYYIAAIWLGMALLASFVSIRVGVSVALVEILVGALFGNIPGVKEHIEQTAFTTFLASFGSMLLTFLAGAEIDPVSLKRHWKASLSIGVVSFVLPLIGAFAFCKFAAGLALARSGNRRHRPQHHVSRRRLRRHDRNRLEPS